MSSKKKIFCWLGINDELKSSYELYLRGLLLDTDLHSFDFPLNTINILENSEINSIEYLNALSTFLDDELIEPLGVAFTEDQAEAMLLFSGVQIKSDVALKTCMNARLYSNRDIIVNLTDITVHVCTMGGLRNINLDVTRIEKLKNDGRKYVKAVAYK